MSQTDRNGAFSDPPSPPEAVEVALAAALAAQAAAEAAAASASTNLPVAIHAATGKTTPVDADEIPLVDSAAAYVLKKLTWVNLKATLKTYFDTLYASLSGATFTGYINEARGTIAMHATTMNLWAQPNTIDGTGSAVTITAIANAPQAGAKRTLYPIAGTVITNGATFAVDGAANYTTAAGDALEFEAVTTSTYKVHITKKDGTAVAGGEKQIQPIAAFVHSSALIIILNPTTLDFRDATLGSGTVNTRNVPSAISVTVSSGSTLGTINAVQNRLAVLAIDNAGSVELAVVNLAGGVNLDETGVISTTTEDGAGTADSATVVYSATARTNVPYRVVGFVESTQATAGTWATAPSKVQGYGGQAFAALSSLGYGQTWQNVTASRTPAVTYYNTTGKPIVVVVSGNNATGSSFVSTVGGKTAASVLLLAASPPVSLTVIVPPDMSYVFGVTAGSLVNMTWTELR